MPRLRLLSICFAALSLSGCVALTAATAIPGALVEMAAEQFRGEECSVPNNVNTTLAAVQTSLRHIKLDVDLLEREEHGYAIAFSKSGLVGNITLESMTASLTTINVKVRRKMREASVEHTIVEAVERELSRPHKHHQKFNFAGYRKLRHSPDNHTEHMGWYRQRAQLETYPNGKSAWRKIKLPSGKTAFLKDDSLTLAKN